MRISTPVSIRMTWLEPIEVDNHAFSAATTQFLQPIHSIRHTFHYSPKAGPRVMEFLGFTSWDSIGM